MRRFLMDHVAILRKAKVKKKDDLLGDILAGKKTIESRWYVNKIAPWDRIKRGDAVYFKESGEPVTAKAKVSRVIQYDSLNEKIISEIINKYGKQIAPNTSKEEFDQWFATEGNKRYCILVFLENVTRIEPFLIDKTGFGISAAWLVVDNIHAIKRIK